MLIATDIGGTFTDLVAFDPASGAVYHAKSHTNPADLTAGVARCLDKSGLNVAAAAEFLHGSTVAINTAIERKGARTALLVTDGTRDVYRIGRGNRPESYNLFFRRPVPFVPRHLTFEVTERMGARGEEITPLSEDSVVAAVCAAMAAGAEAIAVCFLHSYANPAHEQQAAAVIDGLGGAAFVSLSHEILREYREYERISTTVINSYVGPRTSDYLGKLAETLAERSFGGQTYIMQSNGGVMAPETARRQPARTMESGPVGGAIAAARLAARLGIEHAVAFDMGGTTAKASLIRDGLPEMADGYHVGGPMSGHPVMLPVVDVIEVGAGGGSIAQLDDLGSLLVGPESAGGQPGPICYGWGGTRPTVTDANAVLGRLSPGNFLGGEMPLDIPAAAAALVDQVGRAQGLDEQATALAVVEIAVAKMALAVRAVSVERGLDPRDCALVAFGGAGPLHACAIARDLHIPTVIVPTFPGHFSAFGMLLADVRHDFVRTLYRRFVELDPAEIRQVMAEMATEATARMQSEGVPSRAIEYERYLDLRYAGQEFTLRTPVSAQEVAGGDKQAVRARFDSLHSARFGHVAPDEEVEVINARLVGLTRRSDIVMRTSGTGQAGRPASTEREAIFSGPSGQPVAMRCQVLTRELLHPDDKVDGPAVIEEYASTILLGVGDTARVTDDLDVVITVAD
jgi:N-methylhydantoinase A